MELGKRLSMYIKEELRLSGLKVERKELEKSFGRLLNRMEALREYYPNLRETDFADAFLEGYKCRDKLSNLS